MSGVLVPCPKCGSGLRLKDRSKLGQVGRCPKCDHRFLLQEPDEVELELADATVPAVGTAAQWVPDVPHSPPPIPSNRTEARGGRDVPQNQDDTPSGFPLLTDSAPNFGIQVTTHPTITLGQTWAEITRLLGKPAKRKRLSELAAQAKKQGKAFDAPADAAKREYVVFQHAAGQYKLIFRDERVVEIHSQPAAEATSAAAVLVPPRGRRSRNQRLIGIGLGAVLALVFVGVMVWAMNVESPPRVVEKPKASPPQVNKAAAANKAGLEDNAGFANQFAQENFPTKGKMITFERIPPGANVIIHLRPAELWSDSPRFAYFRASLTADVTNWLEAGIKKTCLVEPKEIEEALICIMLGGRGEPPQVCTRVKLKEPRKKSEFLTLFGGERNDSFGHPVYVDAERAYLIEKDSQTTFAVAPAAWAEDMVRAQREVPVTKPGIESLVLQTDRERLVSVVFEPGDLRIHQEVLVAENVRPVLNQFLDWLGLDVETAIWSMHLTPDKFYSQFLFRNGHEWTPTRLEKELHAKLDQLPADFHAAVLLMNPKAVGPRKIIGRFPAMMKIYSLKTLGGIGDRFAQFTTVLPAKAAPNLALGTLLAWDESTRTDFSKAPVQPGTSEPNLPELVADRLKLPMDVDFRRRPLQEAFNDIAEATHVTIDIDGDALKFAGYTKNMPQSFTLGEVPATQAIAKILSQYDKMCVCITDEANNVATVMTFDAAKQKKLTPLKF